MIGVIHEVFCIEDEADGKKNLLAGVSISDGSSVENILARVDAVFLHETVASVLQILSTFVYGGFGWSTDQLAAVQVAVVEHGTQL